MSSSHFFWSSCFRDLSQADKPYILWGGCCRYIQCPSGRLVHEWCHHPYLGNPLGLCQGLIPSRGITWNYLIPSRGIPEELQRPSMTGPAVSVGAGVWCAIAATFFSPPRGFLGQQIWSHSRHCLVAPDNLQGNLCQKSGKTQSSRSSAPV